MFPISPITKNFRGVSPNSSLDKLFEEMVKSLEPTPEELSHVFQDDELKLLCKQYKVKVDMTRFNCMHHFYKIYEKRGSLKNRSKQSTLRLLVKASNHYQHDPRHVANQKDIEQILRKNWEFRKSQQLRFLQSRKQLFTKNTEPVAVDDTNTNDSVIECAIPDPTPTLTEETPNYMTDFEAVLNLMGIHETSETQNTVLESQNLALENQKTVEEHQRAPENSLLALRAEMYDIIDSNSPCTDHDTGIVALSLNSALLPSQKSEDYDEFNKDSIRTSTQNSKNQ